MEFTHFNENGKARMVNVGAKSDTERKAIARGTLTMRPETLEMITAGRMKKGDVLAVAQVAAIMASKKTGEMIPMCHHIFLTGADIHFDIDALHHAIHIEAEISTIGKTGVEMEALHAVTVAALTIYDMCKAVDKDMIIQNIRLIRKSGGQSGDYQREGEI